NGNGQIDLAATGDVDCNVTPSAASTEGAITVSARKWYFPAEASFGSFFGGAVCTAAAGPVYRHDSANQVFSAGPQPKNSGGTDSLKFKYDSNDIFRVQGVQITLAQFKSSLTASYSGSGDEVGINYSVDPAGISEFNICTNRGAGAPNDLSAATGNFDNGTSAEDVRLTWT